MHSDTYTSNGIRLTVKQQHGSWGVGTAGSVYLQQADQQQQQQRNSHRKWYLHRFTAFGCWSRFGLTVSHHLGHSVFGFRSFHTSYNVHYSTCIFLHLFNHRVDFFPVYLLFFSQRSSIRVYLPIIFNTNLRTDSNQHSNDRYESVGLLTPLVWGIIFTPTTGLRKNRIIDIRSLSRWGFPFAALLLGQRASSLGHGRGQDNQPCDSTRAQLIKDIKHDQRGTISDSDRKLDFLSRQSDSWPFQQAPRNQDTTDRLLNCWCFVDLRWLAAFLCCQVGPES